MPGRRGQPEGESLFGLEAYTLPKPEKIKRERIDSEGHLDSRAVSWHKSPTGAPETRMKRRLKPDELSQKDLAAGERE